MTGNDSAQWLARGRSHQWEGRPIDAMLCFRRAIRGDPAATDPRFHLGEVLWQMGRIPDAIDAWRDLAHRAPMHLAAQQALAESLLATGEPAAAREHADRVLGLLPGDPRARAIARVADVARVDASDAVALAAALDATGEVLEAHPALAATQTVAGPLALALDRIPDGVVRASLLDRIARVVAQDEAAMATPPLLLALCCERAATRDEGVARPVRARLFAAAAERGYGVGDHDALRRIALAAARSGDDRAPALAANYAGLCATAFAAPVPLPWPRRTAGAALRVIALVPPAPDTEIVAALRALAAEPFVVTVALPGDAALPLEALGSGAAAALGRIAIATAPGAADAKRLAALDADVLVDFAGLAAPMGPLLAQRPARALVALAPPGVHAAPLVDVAHDSVYALVAALRAAHAALPPSAADAPDAAGMGALWDAAVVAHRGGDHAAAREGYLRVLEAAPGYAPAHYLLGLVLRECGERGGAREQFGAALGAAPGYVDARIAAANAAIAAGDPEAAIALCRDGIEGSVDPLPLCRALGLAHLAAHDGAAATEVFAHAVALAPTDAGTHYNHGVALQMQHQSADAARAYQRALALDPALVAADFNLGVMFQAQGAVDAAAAAYETVLKAEPRHVAAHRNLCETLLAAGRIDPWQAAFRRFEAACPDALALAVQALVAHQYAADFAALDRCLDGLRHERFHATDEHELADLLEELLYLLLFFDVEPEMPWKFAQTYDATARHVYGVPLPRPAQRRPGRLRIGYLSADLRNHVMGKMAWSAVEHHDKSRFELLFYSLATAEDEWTARFRGLADHYEVVAALDDRAAARRIAEDDLDVLVDLSTHTKGARPGILAHKPARVQITHVASAGTVGLQAIDFKLTDRYADLPESQAFQFERLLPMDGCVFPYRQVDPPAVHPFRRDALGIPADAVVIGAFVSPQKLSRRCLALWRDVLARIPRAKLAFSPNHPALRAVFVRLAAAVGIGADRLVFLPQGRNDAENQARYAVVDFVLDPMPFGGVNGVLEPLAAGVPVVTLVGRRHGERTAWSILANAGVLQTAAQGGGEYVDIAARLAGDPAFAAEVRAAIRAGIEHSPLTDRVAHTRALEAAYLSALATAGVAVDVQ